MEITKVIPKEKIILFHKAASEIIKDNLREDAITGITISLVKHLGLDSDITEEQEKVLVRMCYDNYVRGMTIAMALIEAGILNMQTLELKRL